ncbi:MAG TPA: dihydroorotase [Dehalococcoidia bacterium]|nr:dihydroorotase [Dehalococcoidia bacterium]
MSDITIHGGRVIDPANGFDAIADVVIRDGVIAEVANAGGKTSGEVIDADELVVCPGFVDIHTHLREPGFEHKETIETGTQAAARGGFTTVCAMPNTEPLADSAGAVEYIMRTAAAHGAVRVLPIGCVSKGRAGHELAELAELAEAGAIAFSDDGSPVADASLMRRALEYASMLGVPVIDHPEDPSLASSGVMHEGWVSTRLGLRGLPAAAEEVAVARDIALAEETRSHVHLAHISTAGSVDLVRAAKARGLRVTAEVTPHHLALTHEAVLTGPSEGGPLAYDTNAKVNPPLRTAEDAATCVAGLLDGTIDCIATDHAPHAIQDKLCEFDMAAVGISGLETALALSLTAIPLEAVIAALTAAPVAALGLDRRITGLGTLSPGAPGDLTLIDPNAEWTVEPELFASKGKNTPLAGRTLNGRVITTVYAGKTVWQE